METSDQVFIIVIKSVLCMYMNAQIILNNRCVESKQYTGDTIKCVGLVTTC